MRLIFVQYGSAGRVREREPQRGIVAQTLLQRRGRREVREQLAFDFLELDAARGVRAALAHADLLRQHFAEQIADAARLGVYAPRRRIVR